MVLALLELWDGHCFGKSIHNNKDWLAGLSGMDAVD